MLYDVFFSYPWADSKNALRLAGALQTRGLTVWLDRKEIDTFESITRSIEFGLRHAKTLMAFYSENYVKSRICQWELTSAYLAAEIECEGGAKNRVLVINPCSSHHHIPSVLRDNIYKSLDGESDNDHLKAADDVAGHISSIQKTFGELQKLGPPEWYPERTTEWPRFVGRLNEMWGIHSLLKARDTVGSHGKPGNVALISGFGGVGKTLLAEEYALRFGSAYPGGVFWLKATGSPDSDEQEAIRSVQLRRLAEQQGIDVRNLTTDRILAALSEKIHSKGAPCLWVVDDLPGGLSRIELNAWLGPNSLCGTLFTTKSQRHAVGKKEIPLESLSRFDAMTLLCAHVEIAKTQEPAAVALLDDLGRHALACEVVGAWMKFSGKSPEEVRADLAQPHEDALDFAAEFSDDMPHAQVANVTNLLFESVERLNEQGRNFLRLASVLGEHPIPIKFVRSVFACIDGLIDKDGDRGIVNASDLSLARKASAKSWSVHSLISRAVRFRDSEKGKTAAFRDAALGVLGEELRVVEDGRKHDEIGDEFEHARHLAKAASTDEEILVLSWIGRQASEAGSLKSAKTIHEKLVAATRTLHGAEHDVTLTARHNQADFFRLMGDFEGAKRTHEEILSIRRCRLGDCHLHTLATLNSLLVVQMDLGASKKALETLELALEVLPAIKGKTKREELRLIYNAAALFRLLGSLDKAQELQRKVLKIRRQVLGADDPDTLTSISNLAATLSDQDHLRCAKSLCEQSLNGRRRILPSNHPDILYSESNLAAVLWELGESKRAQELQEHALNGLVQKLGPDHPHIEPMRELFRKMGGNPPL